MCGIDGYVRKLHVIAKYNLPNLMEKYRVSNSLQTNSKSSYDSNLIEYFTVKVLSMPDSVEINLSNPIENTLETNNSLITSDKAETKVCLQCFNFKSDYDFAVTFVFLS